MFLIRRSGVAHTSWDIQQLLRNATWHPHKGNTSLLVHKKCVADFPGTCALFSRKKIHFSLPPTLCITCTHLQCISSDLQRFWFLLSLPVSVQLPMETKISQGRGLFSFFLFPDVCMKLWLFLFILCEFHIMYPNSTHFPVLSYPPSTLVPPHLPPKIKI